MKLELEKTLLAARDNGSASVELVSGESVIEVAISSELESIRMRIQAADQNLCEDVVLETLKIMGHPPDAVYNMRKQPDNAEVLEAVWAHPEKTFEDELKVVVPGIFSPEHRILMVSDRLYRYMVPSHPDDWNQSEIRMWEDFWNLRLRDVTFREWILQYTDPKIWDYFRVIAKSVKQDLLQKYGPLGELSPMLLDRLEDLFVTAAVTGFNLFYLQCRRDNLSVASTVGNVDPEQMMQRVLARLSWNNVPDWYAGVVTEINVTDIRESGDLFAQAVTMPPEVLNDILNHANKCSVLGYLTGESVHETTDLN